MPLYNPATAGSAARPSVTGRFYPATELPSTGTNFATVTLSTMYVTLPRIAYTSITIDQLVTSINVVSSAGGVCRMGIYQVTTSDPYSIVLNSAYASLLVDAGTVAVDSGTGLKTITLGSPQVIPAGVAYCFALVDQVAAASHRIQAVTNGFASPWGNSAAHDGSPAQVATVGSVTGALPATFTPTAFGAPGGTPGGDNSVWFRRSA